jgi:hypothetical protein
MILSNPRQAITQLKPKAHFIVRPEKPRENREKKEASQTGPKGQVNETSRVMIRSRGRRRGNEQIEGTGLDCSPSAGPVSC